MGTDELAGELGSRVLFVPQGAESVTSAVELALELRSETGGRGLVVADDMDGIPQQLERWDHRTLLTRTAVQSTDVVALIEPSYELLADVRRPGDGFTIVAEDHSNPLGAWAQFVGARDMTTGEVLHARLNEPVQAALSRLVEAGYKGWTSQRNQNDAREAISALRRLGLRRSQIMGYVLSGAHDRRTPFGARHVKRLRTLLA